MTTDDTKHFSPDEPTAGGPGVGGRIVEQDIQRELKDSYLTYAMSTIMDRALPDVRDGLKPSQRRILVAMNDLNLRPGRKHYKCSKITGDTTGNYHPHGSQVVYPTLVNMAQVWRMRVPMIDPQGNFGSINPDPPAAERYTEARLTHAAMDMLADLNLSTVDFRPNYDNRLEEPVVLPGKFPNLLVNGGIGIAVGMATSLPPHNPTEVLDAIVRVIDNPGITFQELMEDVQDEAGNVKFRGIKGPDFPTGGIIHGKRGIYEAFANGRGKVSVRGRCHTEPMGKDREQIVVDEIPYGLGINSIVEAIGEAVNDERIKDVSDVRNESGREAPVRIVIELKRGADAGVVEKQLYEFTPLQQTFSIINIALVHNQPRTLSLREMIDCYLEHRESVIRRRTEHQLGEAKKRAHVLEGMIYAVCDIDEVIRQIRASKTREEAIERLMKMRFRIPPGHKHEKSLPRRLLERVRKAEPAGGIALTRVQAQTIGEMRLIQLVGLEIERLTGEYGTVTGQIEEYELILSDKGRLMGLVRADCVEMRQRYGRDRVTAIEDSGSDIDTADLIPQHDVAVTISREGYVKRVPLDTYRAQGRGGKGIRASDTKDNDDIQHMFMASTHDTLMCFTNTGRVFTMRVFEVPEMSRTSAGRNIVNLLNLKEGERTRTYLAIEDFEESSQFLTFVSRKGIVKRTPLKAYANVRQSGLIAVGLKEGDDLLAVTLTDGNDDLLLATRDGMAIRFNETDARDMGRQAAGVKGIELDGDDEVIGVVRIAMKKDNDGDDATEEPSLCLLTLTNKGYGKRTLIDEYRVQPEEGKMRSQSRGGKGRVDIKLTEKNGRSVASLLVRAGEDLLVVTKGGKLVRMPADEIRECGRGTQGVRVARLDEGDEVVSATTAPAQEATTEPGGGVPPVDGA